MDKALSKDAEVVWSSWAGDLETSCLLYRDGTNGTKLETEYQKLYWFYTLSSQSFGNGVTPPLLLAVYWDICNFTWGSMEFHLPLHS